MIMFSYYIGRNVKVYFKDKTKVVGYFDRYKDNKYYLVLRDGSRIYFDNHKVFSIEYV